MRKQISPLEFPPLSPPKMPSEGLEPLVEQPKKTLKHAAIQERLNHASKDIFNQWQQI